VVELYLFLISYIKIWNSTVAGLAGKYEVNMLYKFFLFLF